MHLSKIKQGIWVDVHSCFRQLDNCVMQQNGSPKSNIPFDRWDPVNIHFRDYFALSRTLSWAAGNLLTWWPTSFSCNPVRDKLLPSVSLTRTFHRLSHWPWDSASGLLPDESTFVVQSRILSHGVECWRSPGCDGPTLFLLVDFVFSQSISRCLLPDPRDRGHEYHPCANQHPTIVWHCETPKLVSDILKLEERICDFRRYTEFTLRLISRLQGRQQSLSLGKNPMDNAVPCFPHDNIDGNHSSNLNPASKEMISDCVKMCEIEVCFLHIQLIGTNVWRPKMHTIFHLM